MRGKSDEVPQWALVLIAADGDPLRAQEIEDDLNAKWYYRWLTFREARSGARKLEENKQEALAKLEESRNQDGGKLKFAP